MKEDLPQSTTSFWPNRRRMLCVGTVVVAVLAGIAAILATIPEQLQPGEIVDDLGTYKSPRGSQFVVISEPTDGIVGVTMQYPSTRFYVLNTFADDTIHEFEIEREWFLCFDKYERLWLFRGKWDSKWGETQELPSGGHCPHVQSVVLRGFWFTSSKVFNGYNEVSSTGDWEGVPTGFFNRIPGKRKQVWGQIPAIPDSPPTLTQQQQSQLAASRWNPL